MQRHIYRLFAMLLLFAGAVYLMVGHREAEAFRAEEEVTEMADATFPTLYLLNREREMNPLYGYAANMEANVLRESLTPVDTELDFYAVIREHDSRVKRLLYEIWDDRGESLLDSGSVSAMDEYQGDKMAKIRINAELEPEREYFVKLTAVTATGKKIRYYTRIQYTPSDHLTENLDFVMDLHESLFDESRREEIRPYLESDQTMANDSLAYVNIHSSLDVVHWGNLNVTKVTEPVPTVVENTAGVTAVRLNYLVEAHAGAGREVYFVTEYYRVQWSQKAMYLLRYERTMEAEFDPDTASLAKNELKLGISAAEDLDIVTSGEDTRLCFVKERELWYYNVAENRAVRVFSFREGEKDLRELHDQHDIQILNMDDSGNIDFMVYGYMNRGVYEGRVAVVLYRYHAGADRIEEQVYIPLETTYQVLKEELDQLSYVNEDAIFYFSLNNRLYSYGIVTRQLSVVAEDVTEETSLIFPGRSRVVWQVSSQPEESDRLIILDLETRKKQGIQAQPGKVIRLLGGIDDNMIYGIADETDLTRTADGALLVPMEKVVIAGKDGTIQKTYEKEDIYVTDILVEDNVITLERCRRDAAGAWVTMEQDHILNHTPEVKENIGVSRRVTELALTELYITLSYGYELEQVPEEQKTNITIIHEETLLRLEAAEKTAKQYYTLINGAVTERYALAAEAIAEASSQMGYVVNEQNRIVWERTTLSRSAALNVTMTASGAREESENDCIRMLLAEQYVEVGAEEIRGIDGGIAGVLDAYLAGSALNLTGAALEDVLYYLDQDCPVIALTENGAVLLTGYDIYNVTWIDPVQARTIKMGRSEAEDYFAWAGSTFVTVIP